jgi:hypothetical protein
MRKRLIIFIVAASAAVLLLTGATSAPTPQEVKAAPAAAVIVGPPSGWTAPVNISSLSGDSELPTLAVDDNGKAYVCWEEWYGGVGDPRSMLFNTNYSGSWGQPLGRELYYPNIDDVGFPTITCDPTSGTAYMAYHDGDLALLNMEVMFREYAKGVLTKEEWASKTPYGSSYASLAVNPVDKFLYCMWMDDVNDVVQFELAYRWRDPATKLWSGINYVPVFVGASKYWRDLTFDKKGTAHLVFIVRNPTAIYYSKNPTPQNPNTWTTPLAIDADPGRNWVGPRIAADNDGDVYIIWYHNTGGYESQTEEVYFKKTANGVWQATENLSNNATRSEGGSVTVNPDTKDIYVAWHELILGRNWEIYYRTFESQTAGAPKSWGDIYNFTNNDGHSGEPFIKRDAQGGLHLVYHDEMADGTRDIFYMYKKGISLTVASPNGGESWEALRTYPITWTTLGTVANVKVEYSTNGGTSYTTAVASTPNTGSYSWTVPNTPSSTCLVRVSEASTGSPVDTSDAVFTIPSLPVIVTSPNGGESWEGLRTYPVTWTTTGTVANVKIESSINGGASYTTVVASTPNTGSYSWTVSNTPSANCLVRISDASTGDNPDTSNAVFTIVRPSILPPLNPALDTTLSTARDRKTNSLVWAANPENAGVTVANYKIYRKPASAADSAFVVMASVAGAVTQYSEADLDILTKYAYRVAAVSSLGGESAPSATVIETKKFEFAPVGVSVTTIANKVLFNQIKENAVLFSSSPYNPSADIAGYDVYRRKASESDSAIVFIKSLDAATFSYKDAGLKGGSKYAYALKTRYTDGRVSDFSTVVTEK